MKLKSSKQEKKLNHNFPEKKGINSIIFVFLHISKSLTDLQMWVFRKSENFSHRQSQKREIIKSRKNRKTEEINTLQSIVLLPVGEENSCAKESDTEK